MITSIRIAFIWTGPCSALALLGEAGTLQHLDGHHYAWTVPLAGDVGPGTPEEQAGRAVWIAEDLLAALLHEAVDAEENLVWWFVHHSSEHLGTITRWPLRAREIRLARERRKWEIVRYRWPKRSRIVAEYHRRGRSRARKRRR